MRLPTRQYLERTFKPRTVLLWVLAAFALTFASSLVPRPAYDAAGLSNLRFGYPMPFITQDRSSLAPTAFPAFVAWPGAPITLEPGLLLVNVAFYVTAFALGRVLLRRQAREKG
jgi:hypothetical protein